MDNLQPITQLIRRLWAHIHQRRRRQFALVLLLMVAASFAEVLSIGAVLPFLTILTMPEQVFEYPLAQPYIHAYGYTSPQELLFPLTAFFCASAVMAGMMRLLLLWVSMRLSYATGADLSHGIYRKTLYQPYTVHLGRNSSDVITGIVVKTSSVISYVITPFLMLVNAAIILSAILAALLAINPMIALQTFGGLGLIYVSISAIARNRIRRNSRRVARESTQITKTLQEGLGGIRDVLLGGTQPLYSQLYQSADIKLRRAQSDTTFIIGSPRYVMEALGMVLIAAMAYVMTRQGHSGGAIPILGALALGAQRLLPAVQQAYSAWSSIRGEQASLQDTLDLLDQPLPVYVEGHEPLPLPFEQGISLRDVSFRYGPDEPWIFSGVDLDISKGSRIGFIGATGSGKSTLLDIIMGLLTPVEGTLSIDGQPITETNKRGWQMHIANVSQSIFLTDSSITENIAFGVPKHQIDHDRVRLVAKQAHIANLVETWPLQYDTPVGERGARLSGGQRQRIGIARALYKRAEVIVFDEATSALDIETEEAVMQAIDELSGNLTILIIAHRLSTLKNCDQLVVLEAGGIKRVGVYRDIISK